MLSDVEAFPEVFGEAATLLPVVGRYVPALERRITAQDYAEQVVELMTDPEWWAECSRRARALAERLSTTLGQAVIVESKPGAGNATGAIFVANSPPDGYTLLVISDSITVNPSLYPNLDKDPLRQFAPVAMLVTAPQVLLARPDLPANTLRDFIEAGKKQPPMNVASAGTGTISHLTEVLLEQRTGGKTAHIPFRGAAPAVRPWNTRPEVTASSITTALVVVEPRSIPMKQRMGGVLPRYFFCLQDALAKPPRRFWSIIWK